MARDTYREVDPLGNNTSTGMTARVWVDEAPVVRPWLLLGLMSPLVGLGALAGIVSAGFTLARSWVLREVRYGRPQRS